MPQVREAAFDRAISLMEAIAVKTTSEGEQRKKEIINKTQAEVQKIEGEGKQEANILKGRVDAEIIDSYAKAIRETGEFYNFTRTLEVYKEALKGETRLILTTDSDLLRMIKTLEPAKRDVQAGPLPPRRWRPARRPQAIVSRQAGWSHRTINWSRGAERRVLRPLREVSETILHRLRGNFAAHTIDCTLTSMLDRKPPALVRFVVKDIRGPKRRPGRCAAAGGRRSPRS